LAEIRDYTLDKIVTIDGSGFSKDEPILTMNPAKPANDEITKPTGGKGTLHLIIAGIGTDNVTAQCGQIALSIETRIYPMPRNNGTGSDGCDRYYVSYNCGAVIIEINGENVKLYNLGWHPYIYTGTLTSKYLKDNSSSQGK
jgi:hypothetical protein